MEAIYEESIQWPLTTRTLESLSSTLLENRLRNIGLEALLMDAKGKLCANVRVADCGHKIGLNGVDTGRIWFDNLRIPRENLLNSVADVLPNGQYVSAIENPDQRFAAFLAPLTSGRVNIAANAVYTSKLGLAIAVRYALTRRAFSVKPNGPEVLLLDYPSYQWQLLPLLTKTWIKYYLHTGNPQNSGHPH